MAIFANHPYSIICADTLMIDERYCSVGSEIWDLGNQWDPVDLNPYYYKIPPPFKFSLADLARARKEQPVDVQQPMIVMPTAPLALSLAELARSKKKQQT
jgi:hypothetical protein